MRTLTQLDLSRPRPAIIRGLGKYPGIRKRELVRVEGGTPVQEVALGYSVQELQHELPSDTFQAREDAWLAGLKRFERRPSVAPGGAVPDPSATASTARSNVPGSLWFLVNEPPAGEPPVSRQLAYFTQWDALVRTLQRHGKLLAAASPVIRRGDTCVQLANAANADGFQLSALSIDGIWGPQSSELLQWVLCSAGMVNAANAVAVERRQHQSGSTISASTLQAIAWVATQALAIGTPGAPSFNASAGLPDVEISPSTVLPLWSTRVTSAVRDQEWIGHYYLVGTDVPPVPPSQGGEPHLVWVDPNAEPAHIATSPVRVTSTGTTATGTGAVTARRPAPAPAPVTPKNTTLYWGLVAVTAAAALAVVAVVTSKPSRKRRKGHPRGTTTRQITSTTRRY